MQFKGTFQMQPLSPNARICLVIPYFEAPQQLIASLESVYLRPDDSILVVDDGSRQFPGRDYCPGSANGTPISVIALPNNLGIAGALRAGMETATEGADLIARLDCGDICDPRRFEVQRKHLIDHPEIGIVGSWVNFVTTQGQFLYLEKYPFSPSSIRRRMRVNSAFCHPAVMFRRDVYDATPGYLSTYPDAEDFALFNQMVRVVDGANIEHPLVNCLTSDGGISERNRKRQLLTRAKIIGENFDWHPMSFYGLLRATLQMMTPRRFTTFVKKHSRSRALRD